MKLIEAIKQQEQAIQRISTISKELGRLNAILAEQDRKIAELKAEQARAEVEVAGTKLEPIDDKSTTETPAPRP